MRKILIRTGTFATQAISTETFGSETSSFFSLLDHFHLQIFLKYFLGYLSGRFRIFAAKSYASFSVFRTPSGMSVSAKGSSLLYLSEGSLWMDYLIDCSNRNRQE